MDLESAWYRFDKETWQWYHFDNHCSNGTSHCRIGPPPRFEVFTVTFDNSNLGDIFALLRRIDM